MTGLGCPQDRRQVAGHSVLAARLEFPLALTVLCFTLINHCSLSHRDSTYITLIPTAHMRYPRRFLSIVQLMLNI